MLWIYKKVLKGLKVDDPFSKLIRPKASFDRETKERLASMLEPFVWLEQESNSIVFKETTKKLNAIQKILVFALARKVVGLINDNNLESFSPSEVEGETQIPGGTVRPKLTDLAKKKILIRTGNGYEFSLYALDEAEKLLEG